MISDTTIVSSGIQGVEVVDRIRTQGVWSVSCLILAAIAFFAAGIVMGLPNEAVSATNVMDSVPQSSLDYLAEARPEAIDLLNQVQDGVALYMIIPPVSYTHLDVYKRQGEFVQGQIHGEAHVADRGGYSLVA